MSPEPAHRSAEDFRVHVALTALNLFDSQGFEATTVDHIAVAAGVSRRTLFRQFGSKDDIVFADHESLLTQISEFLAAEHADPHAAVCDSAILVWESFARSPDLSIIRYRVQRQVPSLRDREIITSYRYERLFLDYLRTALPQADQVLLVGFASAVTATHNYLLRQALRREEVPDAVVLKSALGRVRWMYAEPTRPDESEQGRSGSDTVVVASFPPGSDTEVVLSKIRQQLSNHS